MGVFFKKKEKRRERITRCEALSEWVDGRTPFLDFGSSEISSKWEDTRLPSAGDATLGEILPFDAVSGGEDFPPSPE